MILFIYNYSRLFFHEILGLIIYARSRLYDVLEKLSGVLLNKALELEIILGYPIAEI